MFQSDGRSCRWRPGWCWRRRTPVSASVRRRGAAARAARRYPDIRSPPASMRRRRDRHRRTRNARPSGGYATVTSIRSRNATHAIEPQYIRAIRSFLLVSNLGCEGVNQRCIRATRKESLALAQSHRNVGKQPPEQSGKYPVNENDEDLLLHVNVVAAVPVGGSASKGRRPVLSAISTHRVARMRAR